MSIEVRCPSGHKLVIASKRAGTTVRCPACKKQVKVPSLDRIAATQASKSAMLKRQQQAKTKATPPQPSPSPPPVPPPAQKPAVEEPRPAAKALMRSKSALAKGERTSSPVESEGAASTGTTAPEAASARAEPGYRPEKSRRDTVYLLAGAIFGLALFSAVPAGPHWRLASAPGWAQLIVLLAILQIAYAAWMALAPDWSSVWVAMFALAGTSALYATGLAISLNAAPNKESVLGLAALIRAHGNKPTLWCAALVLLTSLLAYLCGMVSHRWHKAYRLYVGKAPR